MRHSLQQPFFFQPRHPFVTSALQLRDSLGQAGGLATETAALLSMEQVQDDDQFTPEVGAKRRAGAG